MTPEECDKTKVEELAQTIRTGQLLSPVMLTRAEEWRQLDEANVQAARLRFRRLANRDDEERGNALKRIADMQE